MTSYFASIISKEGANSKRLEDMGQPLYNDDQLKAVQEGMHHMFHVLRDIIAPREPGARLPQQELIERLNKMEIEKWERIRLGILESKCHDYNTGNFSEAENRMPIKIIYDMLSTMADLKAFISIKLKEYYDTELRLRNEMKEINGTNSESQSELADIRWHYKKDKAALNVMHASLKHLEQVNKEKTQKIEELQRSENVQLWQKEKDRVLAKSKERQDELEAELEKVTREKNALAKKFENIESQLKLQKLRHEVTTNKKVPLSPDASNESAADAPNTCNVSQEDLTKAKQHIYVLEKDLRSIENELFSQQKYMIGLLKGLKEDYWTTWDTVMTEETVPFPTVRQGRQLGLRLTKIFEAAAGGTLGAIRADLPDHYLATDQDVSRVPVKKLSSAYGVKLTPMPENGSSGPMVRVVEEGVNGTTPSKNTHNGRRRRSTMLPDGTLLGYTREGRRRSSVLPDDHPVLVNPRTGFVNMIAVMKHFPYMVKEYVAEQWGHFKTYDINGDGELDLTELLNAMRNTVGAEFSATQVRDAMMEVDLDRSETMDFYEYLTIAHLLLERKGRSEVFRSKIAREEGRHVSKTCVVQ